METSMADQKPQGQQPLDQQPPDQKPQGQKPQAPQDRRKPAGARGAADGDVKQRPPGGAFDSGDYVF
jgi:hypothetical protein